MRPRIVEYLQGLGLDWAAWLIPVPGVVYALTGLVVTLVFLQRCRQTSLSVERALDAAVCGGPGR